MSNVRNEKPWRLRNYHWRRSSSSFDDPLYSAQFSVCGSADVTCEGRRIPAPVIVSASDNPLRRSPAQIFRGLRKSHQSVHIPCISTMRRVVEARGRLSPAIISQPSMVFQYDFFVKGPLRNGFFVEYVRCGSEGFIEKGLFYEVRSLH